jgi:hypothetical protein
MLITRGPLLDWNRLSAIVSFNLGRYDQYKTAYLEWPDQEYKYFEVSRLTTSDARVNAPGNLKVDSFGVRIVFERLCLARNLEVSLERGISYRFEFYRNEQLLGEFVSRESAQAGRPTVRLDMTTLNIPGSIASNGYNMIRIYPIASTTEWKRFNIGHLRTLEETSDR